MRVIRMPLGACMASGRCAAVWIRTADDEENLRVFHHFGIRRPFLVHVQCAKPAAERHMLLARNALAAKKQHAIFEKSTADLGKSFIVESVEIGAYHFSAERVGQPAGS